MISWLFAAFHLLALGVGLGAVWARGRALLRLGDRDGLRRVFYADAWWGIAALIKMGLLVLVLALEVWPMLTLIVWRARSSRGAAVDTSAARALARISFAQAGLVVLMVLAATAMARGLGAR